MRRPTHATTAAAIAGGHSRWALTPGAVGQRPLPAVVVACTVGGLALLLGA
jgi:hypothetical protein